MPAEPLHTATAGHREIPDDWVAPSQVSPLIFDDPGLVWLQYHGAAHGFQPDDSPYEFMGFIGEKGRQFEHKWLDEMAPGAELVCSRSSEVRDIEKVRQTYELMKQCVPVIAQAALWWAPERIYGIPDLLVHSTWLRDRFPALLTENSASGQAPHLGKAGENGHYLVIDLKFTTKLDQSRKTKDLENYAAQVRIYTYMLGQLQGYLPKNAYLITRDRIASPLPVEIQS